jgi:hypothetical protein
MKTDVFVRVWASSKLRLGLAVAVVERLRAERGAHLHLIVAEPSHRWVDWGKHENVHQLDDINFHWRSKKLAGELARSDPYVVLDDDHMPIGADWLQQGIETLRKCPEYGYVSSWSVNGEVRAPAGHDDPIAFPGLAGTPYFIRRAIDTRFLPGGDLGSYDTVFAEYVRALGWETGFARRVRHNHLGMGLSQVVPGHWTVPT